MKTELFIALGTILLLGVGLLITKKNKVPSEPLSGGGIVDEPQKPEEPIN